MNRAYRAFFFGLCANLAIGMISAILGISPALISTNIEQTEEAYNATDIVQTWNWGGTGSLVGDINSGLRFFWDINVPLIEGLIILAKNLGCPLYILDPIKVIWRFLWISFIIEFITGRRFMYA